MIQSVIRLIIKTFIFLLFVISTIFPLSACSPPPLPDDNVEVDIADEPVESYIRYAVNKLEGSR